MRARLQMIIVALVVVVGVGRGGEREIASLRDFCDQELKSAGFTLSEPAVLHIRATGGGGENGWSSQTDRLYAYGWIINADTRELVWKMEARNTRESHEYREFDGKATLPAGSYEAYFTVYMFSFNTTFTHMNVNIDHRKHPLFSDQSEKRGFFSWLADWFAEDVSKDWKKRCQTFGMDLSVDDSFSGKVSTFTPPKPFPSMVLQVTGVGDDAYIRKGFALSAPTTLDVYALGERGNSGELVDYAWITDVSENHRIWDMRDYVRSAGGAGKNLKATSQIRLDKGQYQLTYVSDGSHSSADWNDQPPNDPLNYGVTLSIPGKEQRQNFRVTEPEGFRNVIVAITKVGNNAYRQEGFTLKKAAKVRVYCIGERANARRQMADYGTILDARTRVRVWTMDVDRTEHAGGASKNRMIDEVISLPAGSYLVTYQTDDSHASGDWNDDPPYDQEHYGITVMGAGEDFSPSVVGKFVEEKDRNVIAQIVRAGNNEDRSEPFRLERTTRVRIYAIGEGQNREMYDYGWIEDARTGNVVWEMTYSMTFHAGGGRKNRMVNTTILLEKGEYRLRWRSDDSHSFGDWNVDPPDDQQYWGITLYRDETIPMLPPPTPNPPLPPKTDDPD